jgi:hypothetical protein
MFSCHGTTDAVGTADLDENVSTYMSVSTEVAGGFDPLMRSMEPSWKTRICAAIGARQVTARGTDHRLGVPGRERPDVGRCALPEREK